MCSPIRGKLDGGCKEFVAMAVKDFEKKKEEEKKTKNLKKVTWLSERTKAQAHEKAQRHLQERVERHWDKRL